MLPVNQTTGPHYYYSSFLCLLLNPLDLYGPILEDKNLLQDVLLSLQHTSFSLIWGADKLDKLKVQLSRDPSSDIDML